MKKTRFGPDRTALAGALVVLLGALPLGLSSPWLAPVFLVPLGAVGWVLRARVVADPAGLEVCNGLLVRRLTWQEVAGFDIPRRGPVRLTPTTGRALPLTALSRRDLPALLSIGSPA